MPTIATSPEPERKFWFGGRTAGSWLSTLMPAVSNAQHRDLKTFVGPRARIVTSEVLPTPVTTPWRILFQWSGFWKMLSIASCSSDIRESAVDGEPELVDMTYTFDFRPSSWSEEEAIIWSVSGFLKWGAWNAAGIGSFILETFESTGDDENRCERVDGGPLNVADDSASALIYACLCKGKSYKKSAKKY